MLKTFQVMTKNVMKKNKILAPTLNGFKTLTEFDKRLSCF